VAIVPDVYTWGSRPDERELELPCDRFLPDAEVVCWRAMDVDAPAAVVFRWLCQLRVAPYSYDWIDNFGRRSPRRLTPGLEGIAIGQRAMTIFEIVDVEPDVQITFLLEDHAVFGHVAVTYRVTSISTSPARSRLLVKLLWTAPTGRPWSWAIRRLGAAADLVMMRKQLLTLKRLAERQGSQVAPAQP